MREIRFHNRVERYFKRMPKNIVLKVMEELEEVAMLDDPLSHRNVKKLAGTQQVWYRLRVGQYRAIFQLREDGEAEIVYVDYVGPRGDAYKQKALHARLFYLAAYC